MADNEGVAPINVNSPRGKVRLLIGDTKFTAAGPGRGVYNYFSDTELDSFLLLGDQNVHRAAGYAMLQWANVAAADAIVVTDVDLKVDLTKQAEILAARADRLFALADSDGDRGAEEDSFLIVPTGRRGHTDAELTARYRGWDSSW